MAGTLVWSVAVRRFIEGQRVARLATADRDGRPHVVPLCYAFDGACFHFVIDAKPKRDTGKPLKRLRNIAENPAVALIIDHYDEDWTELAYVLVQGAASVVKDRAAYDLALARLRHRYAQYRNMDLAPERNPIIRIEPTRVTAWGRQFEE